MPPADPNGPARLQSNAYVLRIRQHPVRGKVLGKDKDRKPLDPPPVIQLFVRDPLDPAQNYLQSPYYWMSAILWHEKEDKPLDVGGSLIGSISSSLHRLKDMDSQGQSRDGGFFVFGDLSCKVEGKYRLKLVLYETFQGQAIGLSSCLSQPFEVFNTKNFPGMQESTFMSRSFGDQGVRLRIRKESRQLMKRPASGYSPTQTHTSLPGNGYPPSGGYSQGPNMSNGFTGPYIKSEDEVGEPSAKRQRASNASPSQYIDRGNYGAMTPQGYPSSAAYTDAQYGGLTSTSMAMPDNSMLQQSPVAAYSNNGMPFRGMQGYSYPDDRSMYSARGSDSGSASGYPAHATYGNGYQNGSPYPSGSSTNIPGYYPQSNQPYPRNPPQ